MGWTPLILLNSILGIFQVSELPGPFLYPAGDTEMIRMWSLLPIEKQVLHMDKSKTRQTVLHTCYL